MVRICSHCSEVGKGDACFFFSFTEGKLYRNPTNPPPKVDIRVHVFPPGLLMLPGKEA